MEACSCDTTCPCNFGSNATRLPCDAIVAWHVRDGTFGETRLDNLNVVLFLRSPGYIFDGGWIGGVYIDDRATPDQVDALGTIFSGNAGGWPAVLSPLFASQFEPKQVPISIDTADGNARIVVPDLLEVATERVPNPMPDQPPLDPTVEALAVPFYTGPVRVRRSSLVKLTDPNMSFEHSGRSSLIDQFAYTGP